MPTEPVNRYEPPLGDPSDKERIVALEQRVQQLEKELRTVSNRDGSGFVVLQEQLNKLEARVSELERSDPTGGFRTRAGGRKETLAAQPVNQVIERE